MKKTLSFVLYFSLLFSAIPAFPNTRNNSEESYEIDTLESSFTECLTTRELMHWCNSLENNNPSLTENGVYEFQGSTLLSINPNAVHFLCTQDQIDRSDLSPQDISFDQAETLYLAVKQDPFAVRPITTPQTSQQKQTPSFSNQPPSLQKQTLDKTPANTHPIENGAARIVICHIARVTGMLGGASLGAAIGNSLGLTLAGALGAAVGGLFIGLAVGWVAGAYIGHYFYP